jgi:hypothetical protein
MPDTPDPWRRTLAVAIPVAAVILGFQMAWFLEVFEAADPLAFALRDWIQFHRTAVRLASWSLGELYPGELVVGGPDGAPDWFFFFYPPFAAYGTLPLALLTPLQAYVACVLAVVVLTTVAVSIMTLSLGYGPRQRLIAMVAMVASAPWNAAVIVGHLSPGLLLPPALAFVAHRRGRPFWAGAALGLMIAKPNWGLPLLALLLIGRRRTMVYGFLTASVMLILVSIPMGLEVWGDWLRTMGSFSQVIQDQLPPWKQATFLASLQSLTGLGASHPALGVAWFVTGGGMMLGAAWAWWKRGSVDGDFFHLIAIGLLAILTANPYAFFYDALLALPAALILFAPGARYQSHGLRSATRWVAATAYGWMWIQFFVARDLVPSLLGMILAAWTVLELANLLLGPDTTRPARKEGRLAGSEPAPGP